MSGVAYHMQGGSVAKVEYRVDGGPWQSISAQDGAFDSAYETFNLTIDTTGLEPGTYLIEARATDANGNVETNFAGYEIEVSNSQQYIILLPIVMKL